MVSPLWERYRNTFLMPPQAGQQVVAFRGSRLNDKDKNWVLLKASQIEGEGDRPCWVRARVSWTFGAWKWGLLTYLPECNFLLHLVAWGRPPLPAKQPPLQSSCGDHTRETFIVSQTPATPTPVASFLLNSLTHPIVTRLLFFSLNQLPSLLKQPIVKGHHRRCTGSHFSIIESSKLLTVNDVWWCD